MCIRDRVVLLSFSVDVPALGYYSYLMSDQSHIRNFSIIAHIDHGKSTLADRILQLTDSVAERQMRDQLLDRMNLELEQATTTKAQAFRANYKVEAKGETHLTLIDT